MKTKKAPGRLYELWEEIRNVQAAISLLEWDQETKMPAGGEAARAQSLATLAGVRHRLLIAPELLDVVAACREQSDPGSVLAAEVRRAAREVERAVRVPERLAKELAEARSLGTGAWTRARAKADFSLFAPALERLLELTRAQAAAWRPGENTYDTLLDVYEPEMTEAALVPIFAELKSALVPLVREVGERGQVDGDLVVRGAYPKSAQRQLARRAATALGFDFDRGRLDHSTHPFCIGLDRSDVRMTWRLDERDFRSGLFGVLHESGHGLYEQGLPEAWGRRPLGEAASTGIHESQSRMIENHVGRSLAFWRWLWPSFTELFPGEAARIGGPEQLWPALHNVAPSLIRVEADQVTYNLHIAIRFEIERALLGDRLAVADLPGAWNELYAETLGLTPPDDAQGVLQDIHWSLALFGYFPTYTLGTLAAAQLFAAAGRQCDLEAAVAAGEFHVLTDWLRRNVHDHGAHFSSAELMIRASGRPLEARDLITHLRATVTAAVSP
jgi:carboxypeptidase Taq